MAIIHATKETFDESIKEGLVLLDFYAEWCGPCKMIAPILDELSNSNSDVKIVKVNVDEVGEVAGKYDVMSIPTLFLLKDGNKISMKQGFHTKEMLESWIEENK